MSKERLLRNIVPTISIYGALFYSIGTSVIINTGGVAEILNLEVIRAANCYGDLTVTITKLA